MSRNCQLILHLALLLGSLIATTATFAADYPCVRDIHLSPAGSESNPGTIDAPKADIRNATRNAVAGDCIKLHSGTYPVGKPISFGSNGKPDLPIVLMALDGPLTAIIDASPHQFGRTLELANEHVIVDGLEFINKPVKSGNQVVFLSRGVGSGEGTIIRNCKVSGGHNHMKINGMPTGITIEKCEFHGGFGHIPVSITGALNLTLRNNHFHDLENGGNGAIQIKGGSRNVTIDGNVFSNIPGNGAALALGDGCGSSCDNDPDHYAARNLTASNNVFVKVGRAFDVYGCFNCAVLNNTINDSAISTVAIKVGSANTGGFTRGTSGLRIINNIWSHSEGKMFAVMQLKAGSAEGFRSAANLVWNGGSSINFGGSAPIQFRQSALTGDPKFQSTADNVFKLSPDSPALDAGVELPEVTTDHEGSVRPVGGRTDIGAFESAIISIGIGVEGQP